MKKTALYPWIFFTGALLTLVTLVIHGSLSSIYSDSSESPASSQSRNGLSYVEPPDVAELADARYSLGDLLHIKASVSRELQELEHKRRKLLDEIVNLNRKTDEVRNDIVKVQSELEKTHKSLEQAKLMRLEAMEKNTPEMALPLQLIPQYDLVSKNVSVHSAQTCTFETCFEYSQCPLTADFKVFVYQSDTSRALRDVDTITQDPTVACLYIFIGDAAGVNKLAHWRGEGRNHVVMDSKSRHTDPMNRAIYASMDSPLRSGFDIVLPYTEQFYDILSLPAISPARRKYLLSFQGKLAEPTVKELTVIAVLKKLQMTMTDDKFLVHFDCLGDLQPGEDDEYALCGSSNSREEILKESTFTLILAPQNQDWRTTKLLQRRIYESLKYGSIPIVMGLIDLPFSEVIDWKKCALFLPKARARELHFFLRTVADVDILNLRRSGRLVWERYLATEEKVIRTMISLLKDRIGLPPQMVKDAASPSAFNSTFVPLRVDPSPPDEEVDEYLGPMEPPSSSPKFLRNYTFTSVNAYERWNSWYEPFSLFPYTPFDPVVPSEARFVGSTTGFRPVNFGAGGAGKEFSEVIGGNRPREQFTVVMLAYERDQVMMSSIARLAGVPYLNKVIVVWNSPKPPSEDLRWPDIGVPVVVIQAEKNSLNNRFLPFDEIETESVLSVDDDVHLRHDEIIFGFRVWREQRDRIVGFPGRFHAWDPLYGGWHYNSNYSCELSMVLTGAAFFHKYYSYLYTLSMPQAIRDKVDEYMNCEDLAMNFLVSHHTRQPPVKVTNRWTFRCPGCPQTLSEDETHFEERHKCMNFFTQVYGYMPLLNTQYRVDSVLSKTRIPHDKQKCFKYV